MARITGLYAVEGVIALDFIADIGYEDSDLDAQSLDRLLENKHGLVRSQGTKNVGLASFEHYRTGDRELTVVHLQNSRPSEKKKPVREEVSSSRTSLYNSVVTFVKGFGSSKITDLKDRPQTTEERRRIITHIFTIEGEETVVRECNILIKVYRKLI